MRVPYPLKTSSVIFSLYLSKGSDVLHIIGEDIGRYGGAFGVTHGMLDEFGPERIRETPISEPTIIAAAIGASLLGMRPVAVRPMMSITISADHRVIDGMIAARFLAALVEGIEHPEILLY